MPRGLHCNKTYMSICVYTAHVFSLKEVTGSAGGKLASPEPCSGEMLGPNGRGISWALVDQTKPHPEGAMFAPGLSRLRARVWAAALTSSLQELCVT